MYFFSLGYYLAALNTSQEMACSTTAVESHQTSTGSMTDRLWATAQVSAQPVVARADGEPQVRFCACAVFAGQRVQRHASTRCIKHAPFFLSSGWALGGL